MTKKISTLILLILSITHLFILHDTVSAAPLVLKKGIDTYSLKNHLAFFKITMAPPELTKSNPRISKIIL